MKVAINVCYGGFSISPLATKRLAELNGQECYFFKTDYQGDPDTYLPVTLEEASEGRMMFYSAFSIPNPNELVPQKGWQERSPEERQISNANYQKYSLGSGRELDRADPKLIQVIEELGVKANGGCAKLKIVEIPDGTDYEIDECDGLEHIAEKHQTWG